jgi:N-terminal half of MaoC dehydratase
MAINRQFIGYSLPPFIVTVERERLRQFAAAIGASPPGSDEDGAPPTYLKVIEGENDSSRRILSALGVDLKRVLHAEQEFEYHAAYRAGDQLAVERTVSNIYERKAGELEFVVVDTLIRQSSGQLVARTQQVILVRNPAPVAA